MSTPVAPLFLTSWSGGKDSALAYWHACRTGRPLALISMLNETGERSGAHGLRPEIFEAQAAALGVPLWQGRAGWTGYEEAFSALLRRGREAGATEVVFGDIDLAEHRAWEERVCGAAGLTVHLPLWERPRRELVEEGLRLGLRAMIVAVRDASLPADLLGRTLDAPLLGELERLGADPCGENGEYHTVLYAHPLFSAPLRLQPGATSRSGEGDWAMTTLEVKLSQLPFSGAGPGFRSR
ncbi:Dph6-related ATP pyrophosphatase [Deinococcus wulumuqiensis]|uniref:ATPase n=1 Tax=Deinococcus wulumuqiensis TaxID=980427 RepID=A0AAV4K7L7_9DEIO|nr:diphthine--ammonia ligase [Deinococcus wulumuqiensis]QII21189.1 diphthine--ammonia ligase [Deinococcus wulumuqiensis R12]GGI83351.1 ATPase [Deinococcus wulumuqiensis]GGP29663.1 ATPase [Deinococcus wulumuqiensis]